MSLLASDYRARFVLTPLLLLTVGGIFWLDDTGTLGLRRGTLAAAVFAALAWGGVLEYVRILRRGGFAVSGVLLPAVTVAVCLSAFFGAWTRDDLQLYPLIAGTVLLLFPVGLGSLTRGRMDRGLEMQGFTLLGFVMVCWPLYLAQGISLYHLPSVLYVVLVCKSGDIGAYLVGSAIGRRKLIVHISPGKTVEGAAGSMGFSVLAAVLLRGALLEPEVHLGLTASLAVGIMLNITTQAGDLLESLLKRRCGVKDSGALLPAHGGVLDMVDSLLFSFCAYFAVLAWVTGQS